MDHETGNARGSTLKAEADHFNLYRNFENG